MVGTSLNHAVPIINTKFQCSILSRYGWNIRTFLARSSNGRGISVLYSEPIWLEQEVREELAAEQLQHFSALF